MKVLEVNNTDLQGSRFNGYDLIEFLNKFTKHKGKMLVNVKESSNNDVYSIYDSLIGKIIENNLSIIEKKVLSVHSILSISSPLLSNNKLYDEADIIHFHMYHNAKFSLFSLLKMSQTKKIIIPLHDPWFLTGRCVHPYDCKKWKNGCVKCPNLTSLFPMKKDNCQYLWNIKKQIFASPNIHVVVTSKFMLDMAKASPFIKNVDNIHLIPFGIDIDYFHDNGNKRELKQKYNIPDNNIVIFLRSQKEFKGTEYVIAALKKINSSNITIITCGEKHTFNFLENKFQIIEFGYN